MAVVDGDREEDLLGESSIQPATHPPGIPLKIAGFLLFRMGVLLDF